MRVLAVVERYPPVLGSDRRIVEILSRLGPGFDTVLCVLPPLMGQSEGPASPSPSPFRVVRLPQGPRRSLAAAPLAVLLNLVRACTRRAARDCDVVVANHASATSGLAACFVARLASKPFVVDFNDLIAQYTADLLGLRSRVAIGALYRVQSFLLGQADAIVIVTAHLRAYLPAKAKDTPIALVPNGVDPSLFAGGSATMQDTRPFLLAYAGRYEPWAGSKLLEGIATELARRRVDAEIAVAGVDEDGRRIPHLRFLGALPPERIPAFLATAGAVLVPFPPGPTSDSASPLKLFEAWAAGRPTLASDVAGIREVARGDNTWLLPPTDPRIWADAVETLMRDPLRWERMARAACESAVLSSWAVRAETFAKVLNDTVGRL